MLCIKKILIIPLAAVMLATLLAVTPTGSPDVPVLSILEAEPADAHTATKQVTKWRTVCRWETRHVQVVVGYTNPNTRLPRVQRRPIYRWKQELVKVCEREYYTVTENKRHYHISDEVCTTVKYFVAGTVTATGTVVGGAAGTAVGGPGVGTGVGGVIGTGVGAAAGYWASKEVCRLVPDIIWLDWF